MGRTRVYIKPFDTTGAYASYEEVTKYVLAKDFKIKQKLDNNDYNIGVFKYSNVSLTLSNSTGKFSNVGNINSMFSYKRSGSMVKITWDISSTDDLCGVAESDYLYAGEEITIFEGLLNDDGTKTEIRQQDINFKILGKESILSEVEVPFSSLSNGDSASSIIYNCLNQSAITDVLTVSNSYINVSVDPLIDLVEDFENKTVKEAVNILLEMTNSILYIKNDIIYVVIRTPEASVGHTFQGQASLTGIEDIIKLTNIKVGLNKTFNFWTWEETTLISLDSTSTNTYGIRKKEIGFSGVTNNTTRSNILSDYKDEFKLPKREMSLTTILNYDTAALEILDRIAINYPTVHFSADDNPLPLYGVALFGEAVLPYGEWSLTIDTSTNFKILGKDVSLQKEEITFFIKEI